MKLRFISSPAILIVLATTLLIGGIYVIDVLPTVRRVVNAHTRASMAVITAQAAPQIARAVKANDDVLALIAIEDLARTEGVAAAYIIDPRGIVSVHNATAEWGRSYADAAHTTATAAPGPLWQHVAQSQWLYSTPLPSSSTLCISFTTRKHDELFSALRTRSLYTAAALMIASAVLVLMIFRRSAARLEEQRAMMPHEKPEPQPTGLLAGEALIKALVPLMVSPAIVLDAHNRIVAAHPAFLAAAALTGDNIVGKHILDVWAQPGIARLARAAADSRGTIVSEVVDGKKLSCVAAGTNEEPAGMIVFIG